MIQTLLNELFNNERAMLVNYARKVAGLNPEQADDAVSDAYFRLSCGVDTFRGESTKKSVGAWAMTAVRRAAIDCVRKERHSANAVSLSDAEYLAPSHEAGFDDVERREIIRSVWGELPQRERSILQRIAEGETMASISQSAGLRPCVVRSAIYRIRRDFSARQCPQTAGGLA